MAQAWPDFDGAFAVRTLGCDCDARDFVFRTTMDVPAYEAPTPRSARLRTVLPNRLIEGNDWDEVLMVTTRPGVVRAKRPTTVELWGVRGDRYPRGSGMGSVAVRLDPSTEVHHVADLGEGDWYVKVDGRLYSASSMTFDDERLFSHDRRIQREAWFLLTERPGKPSAWAQVSWGASTGRVDNAEMLQSTHM